MELVVVNGGSRIARGVIKNLVKSKGYSKIRLLDARPYRPGVYQLQKSIGEGVQVDKHQVQAAANLDIALEGAQEVVYFTHDYFAMTSDKNAILSSTARVCKKQGVKKLVAICPIEHDLYYTEDSQTPAEKKLQAQ